MERMREASRHNRSVKQQQHCQYSSTSPPRSPQGTSCPFVPSLPTYKAYRRCLSSTYAENCMHDLVSCPQQLQLFHNGQLHFNLQVAGIGTPCSPRAVFHGALRCMQIFADVVCLQDKQRSCAATCLGPRPEPAKSSTERRRSTGQPPAPAAPAPAQQQ
jgi:hypothetical protein